MCHAVNRRESEEFSHIWENRESSICCSKPVVYIATIMSVALAALGGLALLGLFFPQSSLAYLGLQVGLPLAYAALGGGTLLFVAIMIARCCHHYGKESEVSLSNLDLHSLEEDSDDDEKDVAKVLI